MSIPLSSRRGNEGGFPISDLHPQANSVEKHSSIIIAQASFEAEYCSGMSEGLELILDLVFNVIGFLAEAWLEDFLWPDTRLTRIFWCIILVILGGLIWWELR